MEGLSIHGFLWQNNQVQQFDRYIVMSAIERCQFSRVLLYVVSEYIMCHCSFCLCVTVAGELDDIPEVAFYMVGPIEEVVRNAEQLAAQQQ